MRRINENIKLNIKPIHVFLEEKANDENLNEGLRDWVKSGLEWVEKTFKYLKATIAKWGKYFVAIDENGIMPVIMPITGQQAYLNGLVDKNAVTFIGAPEDSKFVKLNTGEKDLIMKRPDFWGGINESVEIPEIDWTLIPENYLDSDFVANGYKIIVEGDQNSLDIKNKEFAYSNVDDDELIEEIEEAYEWPLDKQLLIWGAPGVGKTQIVKKVLKSTKNSKGRLIDFALSQCDETSFFLPDYAYDEDGNKVGARQLPQSTLPVYKPTGDPKKDKKLDEGCGRGILFFDEMTVARPAVLTICLKLINDRMLGEYKLGSGWACIGAANRSYDEPGRDLNWSNALGNRYTQVNFSPSYKNWRKWAETRGIFDVTLLDFIENNQEYFYTIPDEENWEALFASPRSWEKCCITFKNLFVSGRLEGVDLFDAWKRNPRKIARVIGSNVGSTAASAFIEYLKLIDAVDLEKLKLVWTDSDKAPLPDKEGRRYKLDSGYIFTIQIVKLLNREPSAEEFAQLTKWLIRLDDSTLMHRIINFLFEKYPSMHSKIGEAIQGKAKTKDSHKYADSMMKLSTHYERYANKDFKAMMNGLQN